MEINNLKLKFKRLSTIKKFLFSLIFIFWIFLFNNIFVYLLTFNTYGLVIAVFALVFLIIIPFYILFSDYFIGEFKRNVKPYKTIKVMREDYKKNRQEIKNDRNKKR